jgi:hypothetical protein
MQRSSWVVVAVLLAACSGGPEQPPVIQHRVIVQPFASCSELEQYIEDTAVEQMRRQLDQLLEERYWGWGLADAQFGAPAAKSAEAGPASYTTTNVQVKGVDEADFVKNDGTRIFVLAGGKLYAVKSWPPEQLELRQALAIEGYPREMFLDEKNRVVVLSDVYAEWWADPERGGAPCGGSFWRCHGWANTTKVTVIDASDIGSLKVVAEHWLPGHYDRSRRVGSSVRVVLTNSFSWPSGVELYPPYELFPSGPDTAEERKKIVAGWIPGAKQRNESLIRGRSLAEWLPSSKRRLASGQLVDVGYSCTDFARANAPVRLGLVTVATLNLDHQEQPPQQTSIVGEAGEIYASQESLYIATPHWWWWDAIGQDSHTYIHKFDITSPDKAIWVASGGVAGTIVDQFSLDEHQNALRVATTISRRVPDPEHPSWWWGRVETRNRVSVLRENAGALEVIGETPDLAAGEQIYSSRFLGKRGFMVTFRRTDPLYTLDLSNPYQPRVAGELKVPGFSTYLHPLDENHLLAMGTYLPDPGETGEVSWSERRMKLTLFDVSDFENPKEKFSHLIGTANGWSEAAYEHKAFNWFPERKLLAIPFSDYRNDLSLTGGYWDYFISEVRVFSVDVKSGIAARGALSLADVFITQKYNNWSWYYTPWIRRSVMASDQAGNDFVYAVSDAGIRVANLAAPSTALGTVLFDLPPTE